MNNLVAIYLEHIWRHLQASVKTLQMVKRCSKVVKMCVNSAKGRFMVDGIGKCFILTVHQKRTFCFAYHFQW